MTTPKKATHKVMNPRGTDSKIRIFHAQHAGHDFEWFVGDEFIRPTWMSLGQVANLEAKGLIKKVK